MPYTILRMKFVLNQLARLFKYFLFWMIFFFLEKALFLAFNLNQSSRLSAGEISGIFLHGLKMDISTACYLLVIPGLLLVFNLFLSSRLINRIIYIYTVLLLVIASVLVVLDLQLYPYWGTRVNASVLNYIGDLVAMSASVSFGDLLLGLFLGGIVFTGFLYLYKWIFPGGILAEVPAKWNASLVLLLLLTTLIIPIRGGFDTSPLNLSSVAFSSNAYVNQAACNFLWNFNRTILTRKRFSNPCEYMPKEQSVKLFDEFMKNDSLIARPQLIRLNPKIPPNVILVILESFSDQVIASLGGLHGIAPNLDSLCTKSTVFASYYSTGNRSDRGISAILGGYPSLLSTSIMVYPDKSKTLTLLPEYFKRKNYNTSFYYGGDINFYNLRTFVLQGKYGKIVSKEDFPSELGKKSKWGVPDDFLFKRALEDLKSEKVPFMKTIYTISSHPPFDVPFSKIKGDSVQQKYLNSVAYTDSCLGNFINEFRKSSLWQNTLLIITADHGPMHPGPEGITYSERYRIPMIWTGGVIDTIRRIETITRQIDFGASLIHQLGWQTDPSRFSKDFFTSQPHAFYMLETGWGYVVPEGKYYFDQDTKDFVKNPYTKGNPVNSSFPKAYMQVLHDDFISR